MIPNLLILFSLLIPDISSGIGRKYEPEEGTFDRRKRIVIQPKCRLISERKVPDDVVCTYQSQKKGDKNKEIYWR